jgi:hypothetical protein
MKLIALTQGKQSTCDEADHYYLKQFKWRADRDDKRPGVFYARRTTPADQRGKRHEVYMHTEVLTRHGFLRPPGMSARHLDNDGLNNQIANLVYGKPRDRYNP